MVGQSGSHAGRSLFVFLFDQASPRSFFFRYQTSQTHVRSGNVVVASPKGHSSFHLFSVFAKRTTLSHQWSQRVAKSLIDSFDQTRADVQPQLKQPVGSDHDSLFQRSEAAFRFLLNHLRVHQIFRRLCDGFAWTTALAGAWKLFQLPIDREQSRKVGAQPIAEEDGDATHDRSGELDQQQCRFIDARSHDRRHNQPVFWSDTLATPTGVHLRQQQDFPLHPHPPPICGG